MFKFIKAKGPHPSAERQKLQKDLFAYRRTLQHGFPHKPTALAWDPSLRLICVATATGAVKVFGRPDVEFYGQHQNAIPVTKVVFLPNQGRVVTLCDDNSLHLWEVNKSSLVEVKSQALEGKLKKISTMCVESAAKHLLLGTEGGNIYLLDLETFTMTPDIIYQDVVMQNVPQDYKLNPGAVEGIHEQPDQTNNILIGYNRGLIVLWNRTENTSIKTFISNQQLESINWNEDGKGFISSHNDGSYMTWDVEQNEKPSGEPITTYGPYACRAIPKIIRREFKGKELLVFSGGLPRSAGSDKHTVSVIHGEQHVAFDFTSKVIDFLIVDKAPKRNLSEETLQNGVRSRSEPDVVAVLADEEFVVIDLQDKDWKMLQLPYLNSIHSSAITCVQHVSGVPQELWEQLIEAGQAQINNIYSSRYRLRGWAGNSWGWPIDGGKLLCGKGLENVRDLLLTGHEDGSVHFWDAGHVTLAPIYKFSTSCFFTGEDLEEAVPDPDDVDEDWPPYRKIGTFDPYSDDPRMAVKNIVLCPLSGTLIVSGTAGHVVVAKFDTEVLNEELKVTTMAIISRDLTSFNWKGHSQLAPKQGEIRQSRGFQVTSILQLYPPAAVTACVLQADWGLVAAGTAHGLALFDYVKNKPVMVKCTLNSQDLNSSGDGTVTRRKSFKKSLRESFRRLRKGRSTRRANAETSPPPNSPTGQKQPQSNDGQFSPLEPKPVERQIEARPVDDSMSSIVRCLYFARTFLVNVQNTNPTLWAGTNNGTVYTFTITVPSSSKRETDDVTCHIAKEIQLKHRAPVIAIAVLDGSNKPLPEPLEVEKAISPLPDITQPHKVIIASEEQFKIFTLPAVKAFCKFKLTAIDGARIRRMAFGTFTCRVEDSQTESHYHSEVDLLCLTNIGDCLVFSLPDLKRQLNAAAIRKEDISGISSLVYTKKGEAFYLHSPSEFQRFSLSTSYAKNTRCYLKSPEVVKKEQGTTDESEKTEEPESETPLVNGDADAKESHAADKTEEVRENGDETPHNVTVSSSVGDITIDSVKDYLGSGEELNSRISGVTVTKTVTTIIGNSQEGAVTSSSVTTVATSNSQENN